MISVNNNLLSYVNFVHFGKGVGKIGEDRGGGIDIKLKMADPFAQYLICKFFCL